MNFPDLVGQTLDEKYRIESQLGRGGMGTVYLATHLGTERPVAVKVIAPQFMKRPEFVERFRREARAAGRLRHPNVVDVTDFGFAATSDGRVAYLVMEYLDGCTLGEILQEENNLPVAWTLDILEQVCSAVHEAHEQGIIHRDLKPDNIWLEPNQRGGYTVKVLDFGIAKLETASDAEHRPGESQIASEPTYVSSAQLTLADQVYGQTIHDSISPTLLSETAAIATVREMAGSESNTLIQPTQNESARSTADPDTVGTRLIDDAGGNAAGSYSTVADDADLTRVGSVLGTPLYMSPEQCRGERLDSRSDIYSLGVIAYQMLSGRPPFTGEFTEVMKAHRELPPPPLETKKVRKKLRGVIGTALAKCPEDRPQTAEAFASAMRSRSEGIAALLTRAGVIYTSYMPKFLALSAFFYLPTIVLTASLVLLSFARVSGVISDSTAQVLVGVGALLSTIITGFCSYLIFGTTTWIVAQSMAVPLRPIRLGTALREAAAKWKTFAGTGVLSTAVHFFLPLAACIVVLLPVFAITWVLWSLPAGGVAGGAIGAVVFIGVFFVVSIYLMLVASVVMMENYKGRASLRRSRDLVKRSLATSTAAFCIMFLIPLVSAGLMTFVFKATAKAFDVRESQATEAGVTKIEAGLTQGAVLAGSRDEENGPAGEVKKQGNIKITLGGEGVKFDGNERDMRTRLKDTILQTLLQTFLLPLQIIVTSFTAIIVALLYLKTRQSGGEPLQDLLAKFEETEYPRKKWQERVRQRLMQSGRVTSKT